jgi:hypothetical protein
MRKEIWDSYSLEGVTTVLDASKRICLKRYNKEPFWPLGYRKLLNGPRGVPAAEDISDEQENTMAALWEWRDSRAREQDESPLFIMSNAEVLRIGKARPCDQEALELCSPLSGVVRELSEEILALCRRCAESGPAKMANDLSHSFLSANKSCSGGEEGGLGSKINSGPIYGRALKTPTRDYLDLEFNSDEEDELRTSSDQDNSNNTRRNPSMFTFTPAVVPLMMTRGGDDGGSDEISRSSAPGADAGGQHMNATCAPSPVLETDEIYRLAGWSTPRPENGTGRMLSNARSSPLIGEEATTTVGSPDLSNPPNRLVDRDRGTPSPLGGGTLGSSDRLKLLASAQADAKLSKAPYESALSAASKTWIAEGQAPAAGTGAGETGEAMKVPGGAGHEGKAGKAGGGSGGSGGGPEDPLLSVPKSFEEIYEISNRNRKRNKERKRQRDGEEGDNATICTAGTSRSDPAGRSSVDSGIVSSVSSSFTSQRNFGSMVFDESAYFTSTSARDKNLGPEETLDFVASFDWINASQRERELEEHKKTEAQVENNQDGSSSITSKDTHAHTHGGRGGRADGKSHDGPASGPGSGSGTGKNRFLDNRRGKSGGKHTNSKGGKQQGDDGGRGNRHNNNSRNKSGQSSGGFSSNPYLNS